SNDSDYEKILSDLDSNIRKAEMRLSAINLRERRLLSLWLIYSILAWIGYTAIFVLYLHPQYIDASQSWIFALAPIVVGLPAIYVGRSLITVWYKRAKTNEESQLQLLRADQRLKVEELKKKTAYYSTKTLLERYDPSSKPNGRQTGPDGRPSSNSQNGQPKLQQPNMMDPGLRQRQGLGVTNAQGIPVGQGHPGQGPQNIPRGPQGQYGPQHPGQPNNAKPMQLGSPNTERHWYDKIVDVIVGDEGPETRYALICGQCYSHNGLALPQEIEDIQYVCPKCNFFNPSRRRTRMAVQGIQVPTTPDMTLLRAQVKPLPISREPSPSPSIHRSPVLSNHQHQQNDHGFDRPGLAEGNSPDPVSTLGDHIEHSETDEAEFVNNWHDSDVEDVNHDEGDDEDVDADTKGYVVDSGEEPRATRDTRLRNRKKSEASSISGKHA
ncbi:hypothetical protein BGZ46_000457, partial [Entomortierella lignicola]